MEFSIVIDALKALKATLISYMHQQEMQCHHNLPTYVTVTDIFV